MSALTDWRTKVEDARDRRDRIEAVLSKRQTRLTLAKAHQADWKARLDDAIHDHRVQNAARAGRKLQYWHEQLEKAQAGKKDYEQRQARILKKLAYLKAHRPEVPHTLSGVSVPDAPWNPGKRPIANWIIPWLQKSWEAGWRGYVTSGWRDPAYSTSLCIHMCGQPTCPGRCAGAGSRHSGNEFPNGAVDLTDYYTFAHIQPRIGSPLHNSLGAADPVHFSYYGN